MRLLRIVKNAAVIAAIPFFAGCKGGDDGITPSLNSKAPVAFAMADQYCLSTVGSVCFFDYVQTSNGIIERSYDPDGYIKKWEWDFSYEPSTGFVTESVIIQPCVDFAEEGFYNVQLRVTDNSGNRDILDTPLLINVGMGLVPPVAKAKAGPLQASPGQEVHFWDDGSYDPDGGGISLYEWDWDNDGIFDEKGAQASHIWTAEGDYAVQFRVTDNEGQSDTLDKLLVANVFIEKIAPVALAEAEPNPVIKGETVSFSDNGSYDRDGGGIVRYEWDWDNDGNYDEQGASVQHTWTTDGVYPVQFRVTDDDGQTDSLDAPLLISVISGDLMWAKHAGGGEFDNCYAVVVLPDNSIVITGYYRYYSTFGDGEPNETILHATSSYLDMFIARYNPDGSLAWVRSTEGNESECGLAITALSDDSTVVTGWFKGTTTFGKDEPNETTLILNGYCGIFIARYNPDGSLAWVKKAGGPNATDMGQGITVLSDDSVVVTGYFNHSITFAKGEPNETTLEETGEYHSDDMFIARYSPNGSLLWAKRAGGDGTDVGYGITALSDDSIVVTGSFAGGQLQYDDQATFGEGEQNETTLVKEGYSDIFIARYNSGGNLVWARRMGGLSGDSGHGITTLSDDSIVLTGRLGGPATVGSGDSNGTIEIPDVVGYVFVARWDADGSFAWLRGESGSYYDEGNGIIALSTDSVVVTGSFRDSIVFGIGEPNETTLWSHGQDDIFIARYNSFGNLEWARCEGGKEFDYGNGITALSDDSTALVGSFGHEVIFGEGESNQTIIKTYGWADILLARYYQ